MSMFIRILSIILYILGIGACIYLIGGTNLTPRESALLSVMLTILSILATWVVSHLYSESQHARAIKEVKEMYQANLKTYARKAAEKVNNLSTQLGLLSGYLEKELAAEDYDSPQEELAAKGERISSAIHIINALKSVNDTALSDWEGVIGDELEEQRAEKEERQEEFDGLLARYESLLTSLEADAQTRGASADAIHKDMDLLRRELNFLSHRVGIGSQFAPYPRSSKNRIESQCPVCQSPIAYRQKPKQGSVKAVRCASCETRLVSRYDLAKGFTLELRHAEKASFQCPGCGSSNAVELDILPGCAVTMHCANCQLPLSITRAADGVRTRIADAGTPLSAKDVGNQLDESVIDRVRQELPPQPWPEAIHKTIAAKLKLPNHIVYSAIDRLIRRGAFLPQIDGKLFVPAPEASDDHK